MTTVVDVTEIFRGRKSGTNFANVRLSNTKKVTPCLHVRNQSNPLRSPSPGLRADAAVHAAPGPQRRDRGLGAPAAALPDAAPGAPAGADHGRRPGAAPRRQGPARGPRPQRQHRGTYR